MACSTALAAPNLPKPPPGFRIGMEIELRPEFFAKIAQFFDFDEYQQRLRKSFKPAQGFYDDYLRDSPNALQELPDELRERLTRGLNLRSSVIQNQPQQLLNSDGNALTRERQILLPHSSQPASKPIAPTGLMMPGRPAVTAPTAPAQAVLPENFQQKGALQLPTQSDWQTLHKRWAALDETTKASVVRWERLSGLKKAQIAISIGFGTLQLKEGIPEKVAAYFKRMFWDQDGRTIEVRHATNQPVYDPEIFYRDVESLGKMVGADRKLLDPESSLLEFGNLHYHISVEGRNLRPFAEKYNILQMVRRVERGILNDLTGGAYTFTENITSKGLVTLKETNRMEVRAHVLSLKDEIAHLIDTLHLSEAEALEKLGKDIQTLMTPETIDRFMRYRPEYIELLKSYISPEEFARIQPRLDFYKSVVGRRSFTPEEWVQFPKWLQDPDTRIRGYIEGRIRLKEKDEIPKGFWKSAAQELIREDGSLTWDRLWNMLADKDEPMPQEFWKELHALKDSAGPRGGNEINQALKKDLRWKSAQTYFGEDALKAASTAEDPCSADYRRLTFKNLRRR